MKYDFSRLRELAVRLKFLSDDVNSSIKNFSAQLDALRLHSLGCHAQVCISRRERETDGHRGIEETFLGYSNRLYILEKATTTQPLQGETTHVLDLEQAPRVTRAQAAEKFPALLELLEQRVEQRIRELEEERRDETIPPQLFVSLKSISARLNAQSDQLNTIFTQIESFLAELRLGIEVWVDEPFDEWSGKQVPPFSDFYTDVDVRDFLGYSRRTGRWGLTVSRCVRDEQDPDKGRSCPGDSENTGYSALLQTKRETRLKALQHVPKLLDNLKLKAEQMLQEVEEIQRSIKGAE